VVTARAQAKAQKDRAQAQKQSQIPAAKGEASVVELRAPAQAQDLGGGRQPLKENERDPRSSPAEADTGRPPILWNSAGPPFFTISSALSKAARNEAAPR
jgi:regulator of protease activity HflC (stomatin/prohibitin superfamily)